MENKKTKRYYKTGELIWVIKLKKEGKIQEINLKDLEVKVLIDKKEHIFKMWEIDKLKYLAKEKNLSRKNKKNKVIVYFAKLKEDAIIPSKRDEDAGYDWYANIEPKTIAGETSREIYCKALETTLVPTALAMAMPKTHYFNLKHERGSTGKISLSVLAGVVDSGYRDEVFIALTPLNKDVIITDTVSQVEEHNGVVYYPYSKAICQGTVDPVPETEFINVSYDELQNMKSERGKTKLGQSGK